MPTTSDDSLFATGACVRVISLGAKPVTAITVAFYIWGVKISLYKRDI